MPGVQDVETTIREDDTLAARFGFGHERHELRQIDEAAAATALRMQRARELGTAHSRYTDLADDDAGAEIRERRGVARQPDLRRLRRRAAR